MPLICGFKNNPRGTAAFEKLKKPEKDFLLTPPGPMLGIPTLMMMAAIPAITKTSIPIMLNRLLISSERAFGDLVKFAAEQIEDAEQHAVGWATHMGVDAVPRDIRAYPPVNERAQMALLTYWFETRYYGCTANVAYESNREWIKRLRLPTPPPKADVLIRQEMKAFEAAADSHENT